LQVPTPPPWHPFDSGTHAKLTHFPSLQLFPPVRQFSPFVLTVPVASHCTTVCASQNVAPGAHTLALHNVPTHTEPAAHALFCHPMPSDWHVDNNPS
jgi:hypothetical protein